MTNRCITEWGSWTHENEEKDETKVSNYIDDEEDADAQIYFH